MKVFVVLAHPEHQSLNGAMFRTAVETPASAGHEVQTSDLHAMQFDPVSGRHNATRRPFGAVPLPQGGADRSVDGTRWDFLVFSHARRRQRTSTRGERREVARQVAVDCANNSGKAAGTDEKISNYRGRSGCAGPGRRGGCSCGRVAARNGGDRSAGAAIL